ncbi:MAG: insulinase family protein [Neisseria zoodegmatis]|uniref:M16 family metallopeptidase n=1 Tax=Neisseria zoodegmatis TaxID=326523 RepID=UPI0026EECFCB|nr:insulinase family protein [Neisseria zoodegmatis]MDO5070359.1 insulinase family protein [Neisseria zoodegmatis]
MRLIRFLLLAAVLLSAAFVRAGKVEHVEGKLDNGLIYQIFNVPSAERRLVLRLQVEAGAADEDGGEEGIAHITEHMVFQSSTAFPQGLSAHLNQEGWQLGRHYNAQTGYRFTRYLLTPPQGRRQLEDALAVYRQILSPQNFSPADWQKEQQVILAEWRQQQTLANRLSRRHHALLHSGSRSGRYAPIGSRDAIENAQVATANRFHGKWYGSNNAVLVIVGDINPKKAAAAVEAALGRLKPISLPVRNAAEYEPKPHAQPQQYVTDKDNTENKLSLVFRFNNAASQENSDAGLYQRLLDNFAAHIINTRLQAEGGTVAMKFGDLGKQTGSLGFYTDVPPGGHQEALAALHRMLENVKQQPASDSETAAYRKILHSYLNRQDALPDDFPNIVQTADETALAGKRVPSAALRAAERAQLYRVNAQAVNRRILEWLDSADKLVMMQTAASEPQNTTASDKPLAESKAKMPSEKTVPPRAHIHPVTPERTMPKATAKNVFPTHKGQGSVVSKSYDKDNAVTYLKFSNGDHIAILHHAVAGKKLYFKAVADTGYLQRGVNAWQAQLAADIVNRSAPEGFDKAAFKQWQRQHGIQYRYQLDSDRQSVDAQVSETGLEMLLQLYRSRQTAPSTDGWQAELESAAVRLPVYLQSVPGKQEQELEILRYGQTEILPQNSGEIRAVTQHDIVQQWRRLAAKPVNYYIVSSMPSEKIMPLLTQYLADIPRSPAENVNRPLLEGATLRRAHINDIDGTDVNAWSWQPFYDWTPDTSEQIPLLVNLANARLKDELRSRSQSTYSVKFDAMPQPVYNRVESNLFFSTPPDKAAEAWETAHQILQRLPENLTKAEADNLQQLFIEQEAKRRQNPEVWLERLAASHRHYGDARYLSRLPQLHRTIIQTRLRQTAKLLWSTQNARVLLVDPSR